MRNALVPVLGAVALLPIVTASLPTSASQHGEAPPDHVESQPGDRSSFTGGRSSGDPAVPPGQEQRARRLIVKYRGDVAGPHRTEARDRARADHVHDLDLIGAELVAPREGEDPDRVAARFEDNPNVEYAERNGWFFPAASPPNDPLFDDLWGLHNTGQPVYGSSGTEGIDIGALDAWDASKGDNVVVAVIDEGTDIDHPDLADNVWTNPGEDCGNGVDDDGNGYVDDCHGWDFFNDDETVFDPSDGDAHGTHVAGTVAAVADNDEGVAGVAPNARIMPLKFLGPAGGDTGDAIRALEYAVDNGAHLTNNSWGGPESSQALKDAIEAADMPFIAAAGNDSNDTDTEPDYPAAFDSPNILSVAAVDNNGGLAGFSNYGADTVDIAAPGVGILSSVPPVDGAAALHNTSAASGPGQTMFWGFGLEDIDGRTDRRDAMDLTLQALGADKTDDVLLVDDDSSDAGWGNFRGHYADALDDAGYTDVDVHNVSPGADGPSFGTLQGYDAVVWFTGDVFDPHALTATDRDRLGDYLDGGGRLFLSGADAIFGSEDSAFVTAYLDVAWVFESQRGEAEGEAGFAYDGRTFDLSGADSGRGGPSLYHDTVLPFDGSADEVLTYAETPLYQAMSGTSMAAPHAAGVAALVLSQNEALSGTEVVDVITDAVTELPGLDNATSTGGMLDAAQALGITPPETGVIAGTVTGDDGDPLAGATVTATDAGDTDHTATTDSDGSYTLDDLPTGTYQLTATADDHEPATENDIDVDPDATTTVDLTLPRLPGAIAGTVTDDDGDPLAGATVTATDAGDTDHTATTTTDGSYTLDDLPTGTYQLTATADDHEPATENDIDVEPDATTTVDFALVPDMPSPPSGLSRVAGEHRFETAARLSASTFDPGVDVAYVATGGDFADALTGGVAAGLDQAPVLLVTPDTVPDATAEELERLDADRLVVLGGTNAVAPSVASQLASFTDGPVHRLSGPDRFATAVEVSQATFDDADTVYIATGADFPDGLAGTPAAVQANGPLLLVTSERVPQVTTDELARLDPDDIVILGGTGVIGSNVASQLSSYGHVRRIAGPERFSTAAEVTSELDESDAVYVATGSDFADALAAGAVAGAQNAPVLLVTRDAIPSSTADELEAINPDGIVVMGGTAAVSDTVYSELLPYLE